MGKSMSDDEGTCATQELLQMGDGPWLVKIGVVERTLLVRPGQDGTRFEVLARGNSMPTQSDFDDLWPSLVGVTVSISSGTLANFGKDGVAVQKLGAPAALTVNTVSEHRVWKQGQTVVARRVKVNNDWYEWAGALTGQGTWNLTGATESNTLTDAHKALPWRKVL
jgi:hypothetical protein